MSPQQHFHMHLLLDVVQILKLRPDKTEYIIHSNDRPEIHRMVRGLVFSAKGFQDLDFLIPHGYSESDDQISHIF